jgi:rod shape-determining protein MreC
MKHWRQLITTTVVLAGVYYFFNSYVSKTLDGASRLVLSLYSNSASQAVFAYSDYLAQAKTMDNLRQENKLLNEQTIAFYAQLKQLKQDSIFNNFEQNKTNLYATTASVLGYSALPNLYRIWLNIDTNQTNNNFGLIVPLPNKIDSVSCGISSYKSSNWEGYLNGDLKCSYAVYVGANRAPGIIQGHSDGYIIARFIPAWVEIKIGDEVITSGVDKLFFEGVKVGVVKEINNDNTYNEALIEPYCNSFAPSKYFAIRKND